MSYLRAALMRFSPVAVAMLIVLLCALLSLVFYLVQLYQSNQRQQADTRFFQQSFTASINQYEYLPALLARDQEFRHALQYRDRTTDELNQRLKFIAERSGASDAYVMDTGGNVIAASNHDRTNSFLHKNYSFRPYFSNAIEHKKKQYYYAIGATTGIPGFFISEPVLGDNGDVIGVVVLKLELSEWEQSWKDAGRNILVAAENNVVILSGQDEWRYRSIGVLDAGVLAQIDRHKQFKGRQIDNLFEQRFEYSVWAGMSLSFWEIASRLYLVNSFPIDDTDWTLYYLQENRGFVQSALYFFAMIFGVLMLGYLYFRERQSTILSAEQARASELRHQRELETIIENIQIGVLSIDHNGLILFMNDAAKHMLQLDQSESVPHAITLQQVLDVSSVESFDDRLRMNGDIVKPFHETAVVDRGQGATPVMFAISQVDLESDHNLLVTLVNIEKRKHAEQELLRINASLEDQVERRTQALRDAQSELVQQGKAAALGQMAATIVHELSQPLSAINSSIAATRLKAGNHDWDGALSSIERLAPLGDKMTNVIKLLKYYAYPDEGPLDSDELAQLIARTVAPYRDKLKEKQIKLVLDDLQPGVSARVNPLKLDLVIDNIMQNAMDALEKASAPRISISLSGSDGQAKITIEDNGGGIDSRVMGQLFDPYFTTKEIGKGLGLGLSICHEIIQEYQGRIEAENSESGARFTITLPRVVSDEQRRIVNE
jgi:C4-dicarboxylate-specific signal transduction histidine kinase